MMDRTTYAKSLLPFRDRSPGFREVLWSSIKRNEGPWIVSALILAMLVALFFSEKISGNYWALLCGVVLGRMLGWIQQIRVIVRSTDTIRAFTDWGKVDDTLRGSS